ncbi:MAG: cyclopropane-fatty-acyl-phospholipid synthase family protein [Casimicrobiaceae bacterium]|nr:cyclopropane-fatty-acyl-phospholipid synthase family protein [Casimicrobiaceae bacterium]
MNADLETLASSIETDRARLPWSAQRMLAILRRLRVGALTVEWPGGSERIVGSNDGPQALLRIHEPAFARRVLLGSDVAFAEAYRDGEWGTPDLPALLTVLAMNAEAFGEAYYARGLVEWWLRLKHRLRANTKRQARKNIEAHYDLGNAFYRLWLDETMTYSAALFAGERERDLAAAQNAKYDRILAALNVPPGAHLLEIGCGWGGFAERAARRGYRVTGITLSPSQQAYARERVARAGLSERVRIELCDYRDVAERFAGERFDGVASIEMFEAVGQRYWGTFFASVAQALKPGARAAIQVITIEERRFERYAKTSDFIQQYIFPGGMLPSPRRFVEHAEAAGLRLLDRYEFGADYAETLRRWLSSFEARLPEVRALGYDEAFIRLWRFYLAYCIAGFTARSIEVGQYTFERQAV